jgi:hypothetical protein
METFNILKGEHVFVIKAFEDVDSSTLTYSIPINYGNQVPIFIDITGEYDSYNIIPGKNQYNKLLKFKLPPMKKDEEKRIHYQYYILTKKIDYENIPKKVYLPIKEKIPEEVKKWLNSTESVQSHNIFIKIASRILRGFSKDMLWFSKKVMYWTCYHGSLVNFYKRLITTHPILNKILLPDVYWPRLEDAMSCLFFGSLCGGEANLQAALLRARGIPTRILVSNCVFYGKEHWLDAHHYIIEYYCPDYGWIRAQTGISRSPSEDNIILRMLYPEDENLAGNGFSKTGGMSPWFWFDNKNVFFGIPKGCMCYELPKSKKIGVPAARGWKECKIEIPSQNADKAFNLTQEVWEQITKNEGKNLESIKPAQKKALDLLQKSEFKEYIKHMEIIKKDLSNFKKTDTG